MTTRLGLFIILLATVPARADDYLFAYFKNNGEDGLHLAHSRDGYLWKALNDDKSFLKPQVGGKLMRDPSICQGPDGVFHLVWTTGWFKDGQLGFGVAHSKDLITWSQQKLVPVFPDQPAAVNCWAPEIFYDEVERQFLIFWSTTIPGTFPQTEDSGDKGKGAKLNHRVYCVTTKDFETFSPTRLFYDGGFNVIDAFLLRDGQKYVLILKDETLKPVPKKNIRLATSDKAAGPFSAASDPISPDWVEGPAAIKIGDYWLLYYDAYTRKRYEGLRSKDLVTWEPVASKLEFPKGTRHGTAIRLPADIAAKLPGYQATTAPPGK